MGGWRKKSWPEMFVSLFVCLSVQAFRPLEAKRPGRTGRERHRSMRRNAGTTMVPVPGRPAPRGACCAARAKPLQKFSSVAAGHANGARKPKQSSTDAPCRDLKSNGGSLALVPDRGGRVIRSSAPRVSPRLTTGWHLRRSRAGAPSCHVRSDGRRYEWSDCVFENFLCLISRLSEATRRSYGATCKQSFR